MISHMLTSIYWSIIYISRKNYNKDTQKMAKCINKSELFNLSTCEERKFHS